MFVMNTTQTVTMDQFDGEYSAMGGHMGNHTSVARVGSASRMSLSGDDSRMSLSGSISRHSSNNTTKSVFDGEDGTVWTSLAPCLPGYGTIFCTQCSAGTYKIEEDVSTCLPCTNGPAHSTYIEEGCKSEICPYKCFVGYRGKDCLTPFDEFVRQFGGPIVLVIFIVVAFVVVCVTTLLTMKFNRSRGCFV